MTEFRRDPITDEWVIVHTSDPWGPERYDKEKQYLRQAGNCQFCPGRERFTPPEVDASRDNGQAPNGPGWKVRVVPNKFPALRIEGNIDAQQQGIYELSNGIGAHEVVIETPEHNHNMAEFSDEEMNEVIRKYQSRVRDLTRDRRFKYIIVFKNYGESAGTTVEHAHSQVIALPMVPQEVLEELEGTKRYFEVHRRCVFCDMIQQEYEEKERLIDENEDFLAFAPFVSRYPFEAWILPKSHHHDFTGLTEKQTLAFASMLRRTLYRIRVCLSDPAYNFYLHISPVNYASVESFHWHIEIVPKLTHFSGFEWGSGFYVVRTDPQKAAGYLREIVVG